MFIGHYGVAFAAKSVSPRVSLGWLFLAVQLLDVVFSLLVLAGIEKLHIIHGFTAYNPYELYFMPYSHSLVGALFWSAVVAGAAWLLLARAEPARPRLVAASILAIAVFSHFALDVPMHTPDMPLGLGADSPKLGLGLWHHRTLSLALELLALAVGAIVYLRAFRPRSRGARIGTAVFLVALVLLTLGTPFFPDPPNARAFAIQALFGYALLAIVAHTVDRRRTARTP